MSVQIVSSGVVSSGLTVSSGLQVQVLSGGEIEVSTVGSGGIVALSAGALAFELTISSGGTVSGPGLIEGGTSYDAGSIFGVLLGSVGANTTLEIRSGGTASAITDAHGYIIVDSGATVSGALLNGAYGAETWVQGVTVGTVISSANAEYVSSGGLSESATVYSGGALWVYSGGTASGLMLT